MNAYAAPSSRDPTSRPRGGRQRRPFPAAAGQAYLIVAIVLVALCGILALAVDVGVTTYQYQSLRHDADSAAFAGAFALYGGHSGSRRSLTDGDVYTAITSKLTAAGLTVASGPGTGTPAPADPCRIPYLSSQVAMTATYLDAANAVITATGTTPWTVGSGSLPPTAYGVDVTLGTCRSAAFGGVLGHPNYTIWVDGSAGQPLNGALPTPTPAPLIPTSPYAVAAAPNGNCNGVDTTANLTTTLALGDNNQFYCRAAYTIGMTVTLFATGVGLGNDYGNDASFKGYIGSPWTLGEEGTIKAGGGNNGPTSCPAQVTAPLISRVDHVGNSENFAILATVVVNITSCGNPTTGTIVSVCDPYGFGIVVAAPTPTPTNTPPPTNTPTPAPTSTPVPAGFRSATTATQSGNSDSLSLPVSAGVQSNDLLIAQVTVGRDTVGATMTAPPGWQPIRVDNAGNSITQGLFYRVSSGSEPSSYTFSWTPTTGHANAEGVMADYAGVDPSSPINASSGAASSTSSTSITAPGLTTTTFNATVVGFFGIETLTTISVPAGETQRWTAQGGGSGNGSIYMTVSGGDQVQGVAGATGSLVATAQDAGYSVGQAVALKPIPPVPFTATPTATATATPTSTATPSPTCTPPPIPTLVPPAPHHG